VSFAVHTKTVRWVSESSVDVGVLDYPRDNAVKNGSDETTYFFSSLLGYTLVTGRQAGSLQLPLDSFGGRRFPEVRVNSNHHCIDEAGTHTHNTRNE